MNHRETFRKGARLGWLTSVIVGLAALAVFVAGCSSASYYQSDETTIEDSDESAATELANWLDRTCRLAHEQAVYEVGRADRTEDAGWSSHSRNEFRSSWHANKIGEDYALDVSRPWAYLWTGSMRGYLVHTESEDLNHSSGQYLPPAWIEDGPERAVIEAWFDVWCVMGDPYAAPPLDYQANPAWVNASSKLIEENDLLEPFDVSHLELRAPTHKCDGPDKRCPADTVFGFKE